MKTKLFYTLFACGLFCTQNSIAQNVGIGQANPLNAKLEINGNLIVGDTYTGGNAIAQPGGATIEGRTIIGEDQFYYSIDKFVVYGNTNQTASSATSVDNGNGLPYAVNGYTYDGRAIYGEDNNGGIGLEANVRGTAANRARGVSALENTGTGIGVFGSSANSSTSPTAGYIGVQGVESTLTGWSVLGSGDIGATGGGFWNLSDAKLKTNITPLTGALSIIAQLQPKVYDMKWEDYRLAGLDRNNQMGFLAQDVEEVLPNLVKETFIPLNDNNYTKDELMANPELAKEETQILDVKMVNYVQLVPVLTQAIKEQQEQIDALKKMIEAQNEVIEQLKK